MLRSNFFEHEDGDQLKEEYEREASLLVALLVKFPEIGTLRVSPAEEILRITYLLNQPPETQRLHEFQRRLGLSLAALTKLTGGEPRVARADIESYDGLAPLHVTRSLRSVLYEEFEIITSEVRAHFDDALIVDDGGRTPPWFETDDLHLALTLEELRSPDAKTFIGFRDGGRVLVFNEPQL